MPAKEIMMNRNYTALKAVVIILLPLFLFVAGGTAEVQKTTFDWTMGLQNVKTGDSVAFSAPVQSWTGEMFRLIISPKANCYCYIVAESPDGESVEVLYANAMKIDDVWYSQIMELTSPKGSESIYVVMSLEEQKTLAQRISALGPNSTATQKRAVINEVFRLRSETSKFAEVPEKPVLMGGAARGTPEKNQGVEFSGSGIYVKTISIEH